MLREVLMEQFFRLERSFEYPSTEFTSLILLKDGVRLLEIQAIEAYLQKVQLFGSVREASLDAHAVYPSAGT